MKNRLAGLLCLILATVLLTGCAKKEQAETPDVLVPAIFYAGTVYCTTDKQLPGEVAESAIVGEVTSVVPLNQWPEKEGEANFGQPGAPYALTAEGLVVLVENEWTLFEDRAEE